MLLPDNIHPELSIYYNGALLLAELKKESSQKILSLYDTLKREAGISFATYLLCLDWLYLIDAAKVDEKGYVKLCT